MLFFIFSFLSRPPWWALKRGSVLSQNSSATSTLRGKIPSRIGATTQVQIHKNAWFFWNIPYTVYLYNWRMYDWILLCIMKRYQKSAESQNQLYSSAFTRQAKNTTEQRSWSQLFFCAALLPAVDANIWQCVVLQSCSVHAFAWDSPCCYTWATESKIDTMSIQIYRSAPRAETMRVILNLKAPMKVTCLPNQQTIVFHQVTPHLPRPPQFSTRRITHTIHRFVKATPKVLLEKEPFSYFGGTKKNKKIHPI